MPRLIGREQAWQRWQAAAGPWRGWVVCPSLMLAAEQLDRHATELDRHTDRLDRDVGELDRHVDELAASLRPGGVAMLLDLEPCLGVALAAALNHRGLGHSALVLPRWPHRDTVLPTAQLVRTLIETSEQLSPADQQLQNVVLVVDGQRKRSLPSRAPGDRRVDNRYDLAVADLPGLAALRRRGIDRVIRVSQLA